MSNPARDVAAWESAFARDGFAIVAGVFDRVAVARLRRAVARLDEGQGVRRKEGVYGVRHLLDAPEVRELAGAPELRQLVEPVLGPDCFAVRGIFFDKIPSANWKVVWHQDRTIAVRERRDAPGYRAWSRKAGVWQVEPPAEVLAGMLALRVHLDDCGSDNGPLRVLPGSHHRVWDDRERERWKSAAAEMVCEAPLGGVLLMRPLLLHASAPAVAPRHRRVIHLEYAAQDLPGGLEWRDRVAPPARARFTPV